MQTILQLFHINRSLKLPRATLMLRGCSFPLLIRAEVLEMLLLPGCRSFLVLFLCLLNTHSSLHPLFSHSHTSTSILFFSIACGEMRTNSPLAIKPNYLSFFTLHTQAAQCTDRALRSLQFAHVQSSHLWMPFSPLQQMK